MADAATQTQDPSPDIASLTGGMPPSSSSAIADLTKLKKQQIGEESKVMDRTSRTLDRDQARMEQAFKAEGVEPEALKPWNANKEHEKFETDPIQGIGSVGGLFAVIASAFTKAPATNAIEGMAGAINAIKEGNESAYNRAYESYKQNTKLALDRQKIQHEQYQDATALMQSNMAAGSAKMQMLAAKFGDQNTLMLLEHGMSKELFEMQDARVKAAEQWMQYSDNLTKHDFQKLAIDEIKKNPPNTGDPVADKMQMAAQIQRVYDGPGKYGTAEQEAVGKYVMAHQNDPPDKFADGLAEVHQQFSPKSQNIEAYQQARQNWQDAHPGETMPAAEDAKMLADFGLSGTARTGASGSGATLTNDRSINKDAEEHKARMKQEHPDWSPDKLDQDRDAYVKSRKAATAALSGNRADDIQGKIDQTDNIVRESRANLDFLHQYKGGAGLMGKIMRGEEIAENITGAGTQTDRVAFRRRVHELQEMVPRIITDSNGRPLKAAQDKVDDFVAGLNAGDTGPNTIRAYEDLIKEMEIRKGNYQNRKSGGTSTPAAPQDTGNTDWLNAYPVKGGDKRSDIASGVKIASAGDYNQPRESAGGSPYISDALPTASFGGRSTIEVNNPDLGPEEVELRRRLKEMEAERRRRRISGGSDGLA
jgi:hypothetical protein